MIPFKVVLHMGSPIALTFPFFMFDALVAYLDALHQYGQELFEFDRTKELPQFMRELPLKKTGDVYHASAAMFIPETSVRYTKLYKRFEDKYAVSLRKKKIPTGSGYFRQYAMIEPYIAAKEVMFFANGDMEYISFLLNNYLIGIGNDVRVGFGIVRKIEIKHLKNDFSLIHNGIAMRPLPITMLNFYSEAAYMSYKPPYWYRRNITLCAPPGAEVSWK